jgi:hypothetical protein
MLQLIARRIVPRMACYPDLRHGAAHDVAQRRHDPETVRVTNVVEEAAARAKSAKRHLAAYEADMARINELLPALRAGVPGSFEKLGPKEIEAVIEGVYDRGTISRKTAAVAGTSRKKPAES